MNVNDNPEKLMQEEQIALNNLVVKLDSIIHKLDTKIQQYVNEAKSADISVNADLYLKKLLAEQGKRDSINNRNAVRNIKDELYERRLLLLVQDDQGEEITEIKVGLHSCMNGSEIFVLPWTNPICRYYQQDSNPVDFEYLGKDPRTGEYRHAKCKLLIKNNVTLRFTHVVNAVNLYQNISDSKLREGIKASNFYTQAYFDDLIQKLSDGEYDPSKSTQIVSDEFLKELLTRRSSPEFKNIVFSIQKKQSEIIEAPYGRNMIVQGCAGSGKSMIMLHRLPIILYDNPNTLKRSSLYIITPSQMYIQMAENMLHQLEISDIKIGTVEQYYDYCLEKYIGHTSGEYGVIDYGIQISPDNEAYIYSQQCVSDVQNFLEKQCTIETANLDYALTQLSISNVSVDDANIYSRKVSIQLSKAQKVLEENDKSINQYVASIKKVVDVASRLATALNTRRANCIRTLDQRKSLETDRIEKAFTAIKELDPDTNATAIENRKKIIFNAQEAIELIELENEIIQLDADYFSSLVEIKNKIDLVLQPLNIFKRSDVKRSSRDFYIAVDDRFRLQSALNPLLQECLRINDKYREYVPPIEKYVEAVWTAIDEMRSVKGSYISFDCYSDINTLKNKLMAVSRNIVTDTYRFVLNKIGIQEDENGKINAVRCSPYLYLQILYQYQGAPNAAKESLLSIDEAQGIATEELRLLRNMNGENVIFNLFGDIHQHIEGTKGVDDWHEYDDIVKYDQYEMLENYRNALQITNFCNQQFQLKMVAINTSGRGVHRYVRERELRPEMRSLFMEAHRSGLSAIIVHDDEEIRYLQKQYADYKDKMHDMSTPNSTLHRTRWNIIKIGDAKGLEFANVIALSGRMTPNEQYIAYTRALDELFVCTEPIFGNHFNHTDSSKSKTVTNPINRMKGKTSKSHHTMKQKKHSSGSSNLRKYFEMHGLKVIDQRPGGGRLWVIGEKENIDSVVLEAVNHFSISGRYLSIDGKPGWCTKSDK